MKKQLFILTLVLVLSACQSQPIEPTNDAKPACDPTEDCQTSSNQDYTKNFTEISMDQALDLFKNGESGIVFFGFKDCPWCKEAAPSLEKVAKEQDKEIYYVKTRSDEDHELLYDDSQREELSQYIGQWMDENEDEENKLWLYVPLVIHIKNGTATGGHEGTIEGHDAKERKMNEEEKEELMEIYSDLIQ